jgi:hypothetical protein
MGSSKASFKELRRLEKTPEPSSLGPDRRKTAIA